MGLNSPGTKLRYNAIQFLNTALLTYRLP